MSKCNPIFEFTPILVGSANEGTRLFMPDEFDYLLVLPKLKEYLVIKTAFRSISSCFVKVKRHFNCSDYGLASCVIDGKMDMSMLKELIDDKIIEVIGGLFNQSTGRFADTNLFRHRAFFYKLKISLRCTCAGMANATKTCPSASTSCRV